MSQWEKLIVDIMAQNPSLRFNDLRKVLIRLGFEESQSKGGSSHYTYRKMGCASITIPKQTPMKRAYIELVADVVSDYFESEGEK